MGFFKLFIILAIISIIIVLSFGWDTFISISSIIAEKAYESFFEILEEIQ